PYSWPRRMRVARWHACSGGDGGRSYRCTYSTSRAGRSRCFCSVTVFGSGGSRRTLSRSARAITRNDSAATLPRSNGSRCADCERSASWIGSYRRTSTIAWPSWRRASTPSLSRFTRFKHEVLVRGLCAQGSWAARNRSALARPEPRSGIERGARARQLRAVPLDRLGETLRHRVRGLPAEQRLGLGVVAAHLHDLGRALRQSPELGG